MEYKYYLKLKNKLPNYYNIILSSLKLSKVKSILKLK